MALNSKQMWCAGGLQNIGQEVGSRGFLCDVWKRGEKFVSSLIPKVSYFSCYLKTYENLYAVGYTCNPFKVMM